MQRERPYVLTVAGLDPSSGAGLTADIKTFEKHGVYGLAVCTAHTIQTHDKFHRVLWRKESEIQEELELVLSHYPVKAVKFGFVPSFGFLDGMLKSLKAIYPDCHTIVDPIWKSGTGFLINGERLNDRTMLERITLLTPNMHELDFLSGGDPEKFIAEVRKKTNIHIKGGHNPVKPGIDVLYTNESEEMFEPGDGYHTPKHGSGCVFSSSVAALLARGEHLAEACRKAKLYTESFLKSNTSLIGLHAA